MIHHTPAPWHRHMENGVPTGAIFGPGHIEICVTRERDTIKFREQHEANARLIAAAPDLLAALVSLLPEGWGDDDTMDHIPGVAQARHAIAKATTP